MVRVGALRRISKTLLPHSLHAVDSKAKSDAVSELKEMLAGTSNAAEAAIIQRELDQLKQVMHSSRYCCNYRVSCATKAATSDARLGISSRQKHMLC